MYLSRRIINDIKGNPRKQKAVAIAICLKRATGRASIVRDYNPNRIHNLIGISPSTFNTYLPLMVEMGLVSFDGVDNRHLVIRCIQSSRRRGNIDIHRFVFKTFSTVYNSLRAFLMILIQRRKDYIRRILQTAYNPYPWDDCRSAKQKVKSLVNKGVLKTTEWVERGLSYKRIAKEVGCCIRTAERVVAFATGKRWCRKTTHFIHTYLRGIHYHEYEGCTFTTDNYGYVVLANTYRLSRGIRKCVQ